MTVASIVLGASIYSCAHIPQTQKVTIALLPFANFTEIQEAPEIVMPFVKNGLEARGFSIVEGQPVEEVLYKHRVRLTTLVSRKLAQTLASELGVSGVMVGFVSLTQADGIPKVGVSARLLSLPSAEILWAQDVSLAGEDFTGPLGVGTVKSLEVLTSRAVRRLLTSLEPRLERQIVPLPELPGPLYSAVQSEHPSIFRDPQTDFYGVETLAVLPFLNASGRPNAGDIVAALFVSALHNTGRYRVIEPGIVREAFLQRRVQAIGSIGYLDLFSLSRSLDVQGYLLGSVYEYVEGQGRQRIPPSIAITARMVRATDGKVVWSMEHRRKGDDFNLVLDFEVIYSIIPLARLMVVEMVDTFSGS